MPYHSHSFDTEAPYLPVRVRPWRLAITWDPQSLGSCFQCEKAHTPFPSTNLKSMCDKTTNSPSSAFWVKRRRDDIHKVERTKEMVEVETEKMTISKIKRQSFSHFSKRWADGRSCSSGDRNKKPFRATLGPKQRTPQNKRAPAAGPHIFLKARTS